LFVMRNGKDVLLAGVLCGESHFISDGLLIDGISLSRMHNSAS